MSQSHNEGRAASGIRTYAGQSYNVTYLARKHGLSRQQARELIRRFGHDRHRLNQEAVKLKE
jgi:transposase-like protein